MVNNFIPSATATTLGTKSRTIKLFSNFSVKDGGSMEQREVQKGTQSFIEEGIKLETLD